MDVMQVPPEIAALLGELDANARQARALVEGLSEEDGQWRPAPDAWSVAECLDHLAAGSRVYLQPMRQAADVARRRGRVRSGPAVPGMFGRWFINSLEPPVKPRTRSRAPDKIAPRASPPLGGAFAAFVAAHADMRAFLHEVADLDLNRTRFRNPFVAGVRFSLATGLNVIAAHDRRHLWQAWNVRRAVADVS